MAMIESVSILPHAIRWNPIFGNVTYSVAALNRTNASMIKITIEFYNRRAAYQNVVP